MNSFLLAFAKCYYIVNIRNLRYADKNVKAEKDAIDVVTVMHRLASCKSMLFPVQSAV